jgi:hypothetical protein
MRQIIFLFCWAGCLSQAASQSTITWEAPLQVASPSFENQHPRVVLATNGPLVFWGHESAKRCYLSRWTGAGFSTPATLNPDSIPIFAASWAGPDITARGDTVYVAIKETPEDVNGIYLLRSFDGGQNFLPPVRVDSVEDNRSRFPSVGMDALGNPVVAFMKLNPSWGNARYVMTVSDNAGESFTPDVEASGFSGGDVCDCCPATITTKGDTIAVLYRDNLNNLRNSWAGVSINGGQTFDDGVAIDNTNWMINACPSSGPDAEVIEGKLHSVFMSAASGKTLSYRSVADLGAMQLDSVLPLTPNFSGLTLQNFPRIAASGKAVAIVWKQKTNTGNQLAFLFTDDISKGVQDDYSVLTTQSIENADVAMAEGQIHVVWEETAGVGVKYLKGTYETPQVSASTPFEHKTTVFPNPVYGSIIWMRAEDRNAAAIYRIQITNELGQLQLQQDLFADKGMINVDITTLPSGIYTLFWQQAECSGYTKVIRM